MDFNLCNSVVSIKALVSVQVLTGMCQPGNLALHHLWSIKHDGGRYGVQKPVGEITGGRIHYLYTVYVLVTKLQHHNKLMIVKKH